MKKEKKILSLQEWCQNNIKFSWIIPFPGFYAIMWFGKLYVRKDKNPEYNTPEKVSRYTRQHEYCHYLQAMVDHEGNHISYYIEYLWEWIEEKLKYRTHPMEDEANAVEYFTATEYQIYVDTRPKQNWRNYDEN